MDTRNLGYVKARYPKTILEFNSALFKKDDEKLNIDMVSYLRNEVQKP